MKKVFAVLAFALVVMVGVAMAAEWHVANQTTIAWDAVTTSADGTVTFGAGEITYNVYLANAVTDPTKQNPSKIGNVSATEYTITLNTEGKFVPGVSAVRTVGADVIGESGITWLDDYPDNPPGIVFYKIAPKPAGVRIK